MSYGLPPHFWLYLVLFISSIALLIYVFDILVRKWLGVERKRVFSYNHINDFHKKVDTTIRIISVFVMISFIPLMSYGLINFYFQSIAITIFLIVSELVRAFMEWKYVNNSKAYIVTLINLGFGLTILGYTYYYFEQMI
ncbi:DUF4181 domain-containing protein [Virgibacillus flavescens]|uniref:DUF4181 domain-containing protein n=1 Tax=Virgibacillus flavescens TaxID=1611422 RepID=UPI003D3587A7